jgi:KDO2-lipid IV(A) lauroyltransferase
VEENAQRIGEEESRSRAVMRVPQKILHSSEARAMRMVGAACERASWRQCRHMGGWLGLLFHHALPMRRRVSVRNLRLAFPEWSAAQADRIARRASQNAAITFCEFLHLGKANEAELREYSWIEGREHIEAGLERGRGVILLTGHLGNWEVMGARAALELPLTVIARPRSNQAIHAHIENIRSRSGVRVISRFDAGRAPLRVLRANEALGILPDQYEKEGPLLPFFGQPTRVVTALARLAMLSGATVAPAFGIRREPWLSDGRIVSTVFPSFQLEKGEERERAAEDGTRRVLSELEKVIAAHPEQWLWMHRRWRVEDGVEFEV